GCSLRSRPTEHFLRLSQLLAQQTGAVQELVHVETVAEFHVRVPIVCAPGSGLPSGGCLWGRSPGRGRCDRGGPVALRTSAAPSRFLHGAGTARCPGRGTPSGPRPQVPGPVRDRESGRRSWTLGFVDRAGSTTARGLSCGLTEEPEGSRDGRSTAHRVTLLGGAPACGGNHPPRIPVRYNVGPGPGVHGVCRRSPQEHHRCGTAGHARGPGRSLRRSGFGRPRTGGRRFARRVLSRVRPLCLLACPDRQGEPEQVAARCRDRGGTVGGIAVLRRREAYPERRVAVPAGCGPAR